MIKFIRFLYRVTFRLLAAVGALFVLATLTPIDYWWATALLGNWNEPPGDVLIVLGGSTIDHGIIGGSSYGRGVCAALYYRQEHYRQIVLSGGPPGSSSAALALRQFLVGQGVPDQVIHLEDASTTTRENALYTAELLKNTPGRKLLLTSDYHMYRAARSFERAGLEVVTLPFPDVRKRVNSWRGRWPAFLDLVEETLKIGYYSARGWI